MRRWLENPVAFIATVIVLSTAAILIAIPLGRSGRVTAPELQSKLIAACEANRAPLQVRFRFELRQSEAQSIRQLQDAFPQFPPQQIRASIRAERENLRNLLDAYDPSRCADQYR